MESGRISRTIKTWASVSMLLNFERVDLEPMNQKKIFITLR